MSRAGESENSQDTDVAESPTLNSSNESSPANSGASGGRASDSYERLYNLVVRLVQAPSFEGALGEILDAAMDLVHADAGYIRLAEPGDGTFPFVASRGFPESYIQYFGSLVQPVSPQNRSIILSGQRISIEDVFEHLPFHPHLEYVAAAGHKSNHMVPLMSQGRALGGFCLAFYERHTPEEDEFRTLELYATLAASTIERHQKLVELAQRELTLSDITGVQRSHLKRIEAQLRHVGQESLLLEPEDVLRLTNSMADAIEQWTAEADDEQARFLRESKGGPSRFPYGMSARELEVLLYVWRGMGDKQIAQALGVTRFTVHKHVRSILQKMKVETRTQASVRAEQEGLFRIVDTAPVQFRETP